MLARRIALGLALIAAPVAVGDDYSTEIRPLITKYCGACHSNAKKSGDVTFDAVADNVAAEKAHDLWENVLDNLKGGTMPPEGKPKPTASELNRLNSWLEKTIASRKPTAVDPGRVTMRRLNRSEYNNTIRDLLGISLRPADDFPVDDSGYGFDNNGDALTLPPILLEKYLAAAEKSIDAAFAPPPPQGGAEYSRRFNSRELQSNPKAPAAAKGLRRLTSKGEFFVSYKFPKAGEYTFRARAFQDHLGKEDVRMILKIDGREVESVNVTGTEKQPKVYTAKATVSQGFHRVALAFPNEYAEPAQQKGGKPKFRALGVNYLEMEGPTPDANAPTKTESYKRIMVAEANGQNDRTVASRVLRNFTRRAFRRPVTNDEVFRLVRIYEAAREAGDKFEPAIKLALQAVLVSPHFLFRVEKDGDAGSSSQVLSDYEIASRLSYFLWSSMPDDDLVTAASKGQLRDGSALDEQVRRMLKDWKSEALVQDFAGQWLQIRSVWTATPATDVYGAWDEPLRAAIARETELFFKAMLDENRDIAQFLDADFTFVNGRLAKHYGIGGVYGKEFQRVKLEDGRRGGLLTQASVLLVTSNPTRTSPVKRGKWILENILNSPPPPPPPGAGDLEDDKHKELKGSLRQRMEQHRANPTCASCHQRMDPLGFAFENFDGIGAWRDKDAGYKVDASGKLPSGETFNGSEGLRRILKGKKDQFRRCIAEKLLTYATGRGVTKQDRPAVDAICKQAAANGDTLTALILEVAKSDPFRKRAARQGTK